MCQQDKVIVVLVIISSAGVVPKNIHKSTEYVQLNRNIYVQSQNSVIIDTIAVVRRLFNGL
jgi:hypothetical protein